MAVTVGTFNLNNLFDRWNFDGAVEALAKGSKEIPATYEFASESERRLRLDSRGKLILAKKPEDTARVAERLLAADVDVWIVQEVEHADALKEFNRDHLAGAYRHLMVIDGNDSARFIDVGILSRRPLGGVTSWQRTFHPDDPSGPIFSRDLIEVEILDARGRRQLTVFGTHLKSKFVPFDDPDPVAADRRNDLLRTRQADMIARIVAARTNSRQRYLVCGDMNDTPDSAPLQPIASAGLINALAEPIEIGTVKTTVDLPASPAWTSTYKESGKPRTFDLIDQIWLSPALASKLTGAFIGRRRKLSRDGTDHDPAWVSFDL
ncbi:endonuclease/exonuclease/phosphatase family protein [Microlunatus parietis]|uniref:Endonuclease/exonuclease/phosphatase family metal-dependent hydrolase n=1 Tax=Microlunatus parietis TaxID=682979 RepID=A0A7Y9I8A6_9ACTN|nr:endonuclease/exonuclease/phosphatase family protein [Microlunatus parietis]NYE71858.1 endonuclease/exonuclease/phosphatase family metal-dependent hydrolase [Microlunatus parietis]